MAYLGICQSTGAVYEDDRPESGFRVFPAPVLTPATIVETIAEEYQTSNKSHPYELIFREDSFDPITQVRRGRLYKWIDKHQWTVNDPYRSEFTRYSGMHIGKINTITYQRFPVIQNREGERDYRKLKILLGKERYFTVWEILSVEMMANGEELYTIKSLRTLNSVPDLKDDLDLPEETDKTLKERLTMLRESVDRLGPHSVIDRSRDLLSVVFSHIAGAEELDLTPAIKKYLARVAERNVKHPEDDMRSHAGKLVAKLHSRAKPNVQKKHETRSVNEQDAQLALYCVNFILNDLGWSA